jgi:oligopeptide/dipeptide ABC transporter ATP-binding protein
MTTLLSVENLLVDFKQSGWRGSSLRAVDDVSFDVDEGETVGLVGESGSGKSTIGRAILGLAPSSGGAMNLGGIDISRATGRDRRALAANLQVVFQDPYGSLDPLRTVGRTLAEPLEAQGRRRAEADIAAMLEKVGMSPASASRYPSQFSGGQRQRIAIARALGVHPRLVICDEPISSLDLSTQAQVLNLLRDLQNDLGLAYLFIAHDLVAVRHMSRRVLVLYRGRIMESGNSADVCSRPLHPYSLALWAAAPVPEPAEQARRRAARALAVRKTSTSMVAPPVEGCPFAPRCPLAEEICWKRRPSDSAFAGRTIACHLFDETSGHPGGAEHRSALSAGG